MPKPINENIRNIRIEDEAGDVRPLLDLASEKLAELIAAVTSHGKAGSFTMKLDIKPSTAGALAVRGDVKITKPKGLPPETLLWATPDGNLMSEDPRQTKLELRGVKDDKKELRPVIEDDKTELRTVQA